MSTFADNYLHGGGGGLKINREPLWRAKNMWLKFGDGWLKGS